MTEDAVTAFFEDLGSRGYDPLLRSVSATVRFDLVSGKTTERWLLTIQKGNLSVSHRNVRADAVIRLSRALFGGAAALALAGPGEYSLDSLLARRRVAAGMARL